MGKNTILEVNNLTKQYKGNLEPTVSNLSFSVSKNEIYGLLGPNGAGKTTSISTITGILPITSGSVLIDGKDIKHDLQEIKNLIGVISQDIALYDKLTAFENLKYFGGLYGINKKILIEKIDNLLHQLGLFKHKNVTINKFSGGMKRRINLIAGILHNPKLLFLDEPTAGVDVQTRNVIREFLVELKDAGTAIVYTSHQMEDIQKVCDKVAIIDHGKLLCSDKPDALIDKYEDCSSLEDVFLNLTGKSLRD